MNKLLLILPFAFAASLGSAQTWGGSGTWSFQPAPDDFKPDALLDLRSMNEKFAGEHGHVRTTPDGGFAFANGDPIRFWAVNTNVGQEKPFTPKPLGRKVEPDLARHARFLASGA